MSNYVKSTNFASKDSLTTGNPLKIVKGAEIDTEFNNIATAVATKADLNSPTFLGTPSGPTATLGTTNTQLATTEFVASAILAISSSVSLAVYPIGSIYISTSTVNPATLMGFGTWVSFGAGRVLVGLDAGNSLFDTPEETGGSADAIAVGHTHTGTASSSGAHTHTVGPTAGPNASSYNVESGGGWAFWKDNTLTTSADGAHTHSVTVDSTGSSGTNQNYQPYITVVMWKRTA